MGCGGREDSIHLTSLSVSNRPILCRKIIVIFISYLDDRIEKMQAFMFNRICTWRRELARLRS